MSKLFEAHGTFQSLCRVLEALPTRLPDETPLRDVIPGVWPTVGDLRKLCGEMEAVAGVLAEARKP